MIQKSIILIFFLLHSILFAQEFSWQDVSADFSLPEGVVLFQGISQSPKIKAWYLDVDFNQPNLALRPYLAAIPAGKEGVPAFCQRVGAVAAINGGYFDTNGTTSYSAVVYPGEVVAQNISAVSRSGQSYPVTRSFFGISRTRTLAINWIYHFGNQVTDIFSFDAPLPNVDGTPAPVPQKSDGNLLADLLVGIGGGPTLIKNGQLHITYNAEVFWGSGIGYETPNPRSAVGCTANNHIILMVVDGRQDASAGMSLPQLAELLQKLGCVEAMNLDGGGSTQMAVGGKLVNRPEGGNFTRAVPTILAVVPADSLPLPGENYFEKVMDTGDGGCRIIGSGWFESANAGFWGETKSLLHSPGTGANFVRFRPLLPVAKYEVFAWWVAAFNRCITPILIHHRDGCDTVRVDQTRNGSKWNSLGFYYFTGDSAEQVLVSDAATQGSYVVADAVRFLAPKNQAGIKITGHFPQKALNSPVLQNYPNPFNSSTKIFFQVSRSTRVSLKIYNLLGQPVARLIDEYLPAGEYSALFQAQALPSGVYLSELRTADFQEVKRMVLIR